MGRLDAPGFINGRIHDHLLRTKISIIRDTSKPLYVLPGASGRVGRAAVVRTTKCPSGRTPPPFLPPAPAAAAPHARPPHTPRQHGQTGAGDNGSHCGSITFSGGTTVATGGYSMRGIGAGPSSSCGDIYFTGSASGCRVTSNGGLELDTSWKVYIDGVQATYSQLSASPFVYPISTP